MIQLPDPSRLYDLLHIQVYGVPIVSILLIAGAGCFLGAWYWRANMKSETKLVQSNQSGLPSAGEFVKEQKDKTEAIAQTASRTTVAMSGLARAAYHPPPPPSAYCVKCKARREMLEPQTITNKKGKPMLKSLCPACGTEMFLPSSPKFNGHGDTEALLLGVMIERLKTANISGGRVSMIIDPTSEKTISLGKSQVDFDLGIPVSYEEHSTEVESLKAELGAVNAKLDSIAAAQEAKEKEGA